MIEKIHWLGQAGFRIEDELVIYIDPYKIKGGREADIILISHDHFDHCSPEDIEKVKKDDTVIVASKGAASKLSGNVRILKPGDKINIKSIDIEGVSSYNIGKDFHPQAAGNLGFIITVADTHSLRSGLQVPTRIYHAGDTDLIPEMKEIKADIALLPVGGTYTMDAKEAAEAANTINPKIAIPIHWGSVVGLRKDAKQFQKLCKGEVRILEEEK